MIVCTFLFYYWQCLFDYYSCFCLKFHRFVLLSYEVESGIWASFFLVAVVVGIFFFCFCEFIYLFLIFCFSLQRKSACFVYMWRNLGLSVSSSKTPLFGISLQSTTPLHLVFTFFYLFTFSVLFYRLFIYFF